MKRVRYLLMALVVIALLAVLFRYIFTQDTLSLIAGLAVGVLAMIVMFRFQSFEQSAISGLTPEPVPRRDRRLYIVSGTIAMVAAVLWYAAGHALVPAASRWLFPGVDLPVTGLALFGGAALAIVFGIRS